MRLIPASQCRRVRWKNDGGWTTEIARSDDPLCGAGDFRWRISIAEIESDGPFSAFPGIARDLLLLDGNGIELDIGEAAPLQLTQRFERVHFDGAATVQCRLLEGPTRDFNVMARYDSVRAEVIARPLIGSMLIFPEPGVEWLLHLLGGHASARCGSEEVKFEAGASLHLDFREGDMQRVVLDGSGELVLVKLSSIDSSSS